MFVIHPSDRSTAMLSALYEGLSAEVIHDNRSTKQIGHLLNHVPVRERILLLGHGSDKGLFYRDDDTRKEFDRLIVSHSHAYYLRNHGNNLVAVWCHADLFARAERLHGLFTGMIISELEEAALYGVDTSQEELDRENVKLARRLRGLLDEGINLSEIPARMLDLDDARTALTSFNYAHFYWL